MKPTIVFSVLLVVLFSIVSTDADAYCRRYYRHCAPRCRERVVYVAPPVYQAPVVYYQAPPRYCPPPRYYARAAYYSRPHYYRHCR